MKQTINLLSLTILLSVLSQSPAQSAEHKHDASGNHVLSVDITHKILNNTSGSCADYATDYHSSVTDIQNHKKFAGELTISFDDKICTIKSNNIPNHDFNNEGARFVTSVTEIAQNFIIPRQPKVAKSPTVLSHRRYQAVMLNGVVVDILSAGCYRPDGRRTDSHGNVKIGCKPEDKWVTDPLGPGAGFGTDKHNAHVQPGGVYHYHGNPLALFNDKPTNKGSPVVGFAADGFPVYGSYFKDKQGQVREALSGYSLKKGQRPISKNDPGGKYDGMYIDDYEFTASGDLDQCNGMTVNGQYGYYVTNSYPWILACISGKPDPSFNKKRRGDESRQGDKRKGRDGIKANKFSGKKNH